MSEKLKATVVLCTYNPRKDLLRQALNSVARQTADRHSFDVIVVDNNSTPALDADDLAAMVGGEVQVLREMRQGLTFARVCGFSNATGDIIVFLDDDNVLDPDYVARALSIAAENPRLGVFGGRCRGVFESPIGGFKKRFAGFLGVRDMGDQVLTGEGDAWGPHEPIGAGMVVRAAVGTAYCEFINGCEKAGSLGRSGKALMAGEDSLISRMSHLLGYQVGYWPQLGLDHHITAGRLKLRYLFRLMIGHGRSYVSLHMIVDGQPPHACDRFPVKRYVKECTYMMKKFGFLEGLIKSFWQYGYYAQCIKLYGQRTEALRESSPFANALSAANQGSPTLS